MRELRRKDRKMPPKEAEELLVRGEYGVLSTVGEDGTPYGVPLSYVYREGAIYFHCALEGHKLENLRRDPRVSFCVVGRIQLLPEKFSTEYESVVAFGTASEIDGEERQRALVWLLEKYSASFLPEGKRYIEQLDRATKVVKIAVHHLAGKARR